MKNLFRFALFFILLNNYIFANTSLEKITVQLAWKHQFEYAGFYAAIEKGYYKDIGLDVQLKEFQEGIDTTQEVLNGNATFGISTSALILEKLNKKPVVLIASYFKQNALALVTKPSIKTPTDLKNKKILALESELNHTSLAVMLKDFGLAKDDYTLVNHDFKIDKFVNGEVDAMSVFITSQLFDLDKAGVKYNVLNPANFGVFSYDGELFTSQNVINSDLQKVQNFVEATNKGWEYAFKNKEELINLIYDKYTKRKTKDSLLFEANQTEKIFKTNVFKIGAIAPELIKLNADMYSHLGLVDKNYDLNTMLLDYYINQKNKINSLLTLEEKNYLKNNPSIKVSNELKNSVNEWPAIQCNFGSFKLANGSYALMNQRIGVVNTETPLFVFNETNGLKTGSFFGDGLWRWKLRDFLDHDSHQLFNELIHKTVQYLSTKADKSFFRVYTKKIIYENEPINFTAELYNQSYELISEPDVTLVLTNEKNNHFNFAFSKKQNNYQLTAGQFPSGEYTYEANAKVGDKVYKKTGNIIIKEIISEKINTLANHSLLYQLSKESGGKLVYKNELDQLQESILKNDSIKSISYLQKQITDLINLKWIFALIIALLTTEWYIRKQQGGI